MEERRYRSLRIVAVLLRVLAVIVAVAGVLFVVVGRLGAFDGALSNVPADVGPGLTASMIVGVLAVALYALLLWASGAMINLFIDLEKNTRTTADLLEDLGRSLRTPPPPPE